MNQCTDTKITTQEVISLTEYIIPACSVYISTLYGSIMWCPKSGQPIWSQWRLVLTVPRVHHIVGVITNLTVILYAARSVFGLSKLFLPKSLSNKICNSIYSRKAGKFTYCRPKIVTWQWKGTVHAFLSLPYPLQTVQPSQYGRDSTDLKVWVPNLAHTLLGIQNVPWSARDGSWLSYVRSCARWLRSIMCALMRLCAPALLHLKMQLKGPA